MSNEREGERVRCLYCGANNFPASDACWQCSRPLRAMRPAPATANAAPAAPPSSVPGASARPAFADISLAPKAAAALGMMFPYVGLPAGILFLMLDDPRKTQLGWLLIGWSAAGTVLNSLALAAVLGPVWAVLRSLTPHPGGGSAPPPGLPTLPADPGAVLNAMLLSLTHLLSRI